MRNLNLGPISQTTDSTYSNLMYISPSPGEFPIIASTICVDIANPTREEFLKARECGFSAGSSQVYYATDDNKVSSGDLTTKFKPAMLNSGIGLLVSNTSLTKSPSPGSNYTFAFDDPAVLASYKIRMSYTVQQSFVSGLGVGDEPKWADFAESGNPLTNPLTCIEGSYTRIYRIAKNNMISKCDSNDVPYRPCMINLAASDDKVYIGPWAQEDSTNYYKYLKAVQELIHPMCWSFDLYPGVINYLYGFLYAKNLKNLYGFLDRFLQISFDTRRPFRMICLATEFENGSGSYQPTPNINRLRFETFTALAYGAQEIQYWTYCQRRHSDHPSEKDGILSTEFYISSPISRFGRRNQIWYSIQKVNEEIRRYSKVFMGCYVRHIEHVGNNYITPLSTEKPDGLYNFIDEDFQSPLSVTIVSEPTYKITQEQIKIDNSPEIFQGVMVSYLQNDPDNLSTDAGGDPYTEGENSANYAVIVNHDPDNYKTISIEFEEGYDITELTPRILNCQSESSSPRTIVRELMPGGYLIFQYKKIK